MSGPDRIARRYRRAARSLRIVQWARVAPTFDERFGRTFAKAWDERNGV